MGCDVVHTESEGECVVPSESGIRKEGVISGLVLVGRKQCSSRQYMHKCFVSINL